MLILLLERTTGMDLLLQSPKVQKIHSQNPDSFFCKKKAVCSSSAFTAPLLAQSDLDGAGGGSRGRSHGDAVLMMDHQVFDPTGIATSPVYGLRSPITNLTLTSTWGIAASGFPKGTSIGIPSARLLIHLELFSFSIFKRAVWISLVLWWFYCPLGKKFQISWFFPCIFCTVTLKRSL